MCSDILKTVMFCAVMVTSFMNLRALENGDRWRALILIQIRMKHIGAQHDGWFSFFMIDLQVLPSVQGLFKHIVIKRFYLSCLLTLPQIFGTLFNGNICYAQGFSNTYFSRTHLFGFSVFLRSNDSKMPQCLFLMLMRNQILRARVIYIVVTKKTYIAYAKEFKEEGVAYWRLE